MNHHGNTKGRLDSVINSCKCRYRNVRPHSLPAESHSFVGMARETAAMPPACESWWKNGERSGGGKPFVQGWTHTHKELQTISVLPDCR